MTRLLVVDDEPSVLFSMEKCLAPLQLQVLTAGSGQAALEAVESENPDVVILDVCLPDMSGLDVYDRVHKKNPRTPIIVVTAFAKTDTAIEAMKRGAFEYLVKPVDVQRLRQVVARAAEVSRLSGTPLQPSELPAMAADAAAEGIVGQSPAMQEVYKVIGRVASQDVTALILGESGTGKEVVAKTIWRYSNRATKPFVAINCAAIPEALLESELFGYEKGSFTGATERHVGKFEFASGGTVFLDEIGDMSSATQAKVLRVIQDQKFERIGGTQTVNTDVRIIAATNRNLASMASEGTFRQDLFYRINGFTITLPPLRERRGDIAALTSHFINRFNRQMGKSVRGVTPAALQWLEAQDWPGNVRELQNTIKYAMIKAVADVLMPEVFPHAEHSASTLNGSSHGGNGSSDGAQEKVVPDGADDFPAIAALARQLIEQMPGDVYRKLTGVVDSVVLDVALRYTKGNQLHAALLLGISRTTLRAKLRALGFTVEKQLATEDDGAAIHRLK